MLIKLIIFSICSSIVKLVESISIAFFGRINGEISRVESIKSLSAIEALISSIDKNSPILSNSSCLRFDLTSKSAVRKNLKSASGKTTEPISLPSITQSTLLPISLCRLTKNFLTALIELTSLTFEVISFFLISNDNNSPLINISFEFLYEILILSKKNSHEHSRIKRKNF